MSRDLEKIYAKIAAMAIQRSCSKLVSGEEDTKLRKKETVRLSKEALSVLRIWLSFPDTTLEEEEELESIDEPVMKIIIADALLNIGSLIKEIRPNEPRNVSKQISVVYRNAKVVAGASPDTFMILQYSKIATQELRSISDEVRALRNVFFSGGLVDSNGVALSDINIPCSPSTLSGIISGGTLSGAKVFEALLG